MCVRFYGQNIAFLGLKRNKPESTRGVLHQPARSKDITLSSVDKNKKTKGLFELSAKATNLIVGMTFLRLVPSSFQEVLRNIKSAREGRALSLTLKAEEIENTLMSFFISDKKNYAEWYEKLIHDIQEIAHIYAKAQRASDLSVSLHPGFDALQPFRPHGGLRIIYDTSPGEDGWAIFRMDGMRAKLNEHAFYTDIEVSTLEESGHLNIRDHNIEFLARLEDYKRELSEREYAGASEISPQLLAKLMNIEAINFEEGSLESDEEAEADKEEGQGFEPLEGEDEKAEASEAPEPKEDEEEGESAEEEAETEESEEPEEGAEKSEEEDAEGGEEAEVEKEEGEEPEDEGEESEAGESEAPETEGAEKSEEEGAEDGEETEVEKEELEEGSEVEGAGEGEDEGEGEVEESEEPEEEGVEESEKEEATEGSEEAEAEKEEGGEPKEGPEAEKEEGEEPEEGSGAEGEGEEAEESEEPEEEGVEESEKEEATEGGEEADAEKEEGGEPKEGPEAEKEEGEEPAEEGSGAEGEGEEAEESEEPEEEGVEESEKEEATEGSEEADAEKEEGGEPKEGPEAEKEERKEPEEGSEVEREGESEKEEGDSGESEEPERENVEASEKGEASENSEKAEKEEDKEPEERPEVEGEESETEEPEAEDAKESEKGETSEMNEDSATEKREAEEGAETEGEVEQDKPEGGEKSDLEAQSEGKNEEDKEAKTNEIGQEEVETPAEVPEREADTAEEGDAKKIDETEAPEKKTVEGSETQELEKGEILVAEDSESVAEEEKLENNGEQDKLEGSSEEKANKTENDVKNPDPQEISKTQETQSLENTEATLKEERVGKEETSNAENKDRSKEEFKTVERELVNEPPVTDVPNVEKETDKADEQKQNKREKQDNLDPLGDEKVGSSDASHNNKSASDKRDYASPENIQKNERDNAQSNREKLDAPTPDKGQNESTIPKQDMRYGEEVGSNSTTANDPSFAEKSGTSKILSEQTLSADGNNSAFLRRDYLQENIESNHTQNFQRTGTLDDKAHSGILPQNQNEQNLKTAFEKSAHLLDDIFDGRDALQSRITTRLKIPLNDRLYSTVMSTIPITSLKLSTYSNTQSLLTNPSSIDPAHSIANALLNKKNFMLTKPAQELHVRYPNMNHSFGTMFTNMPSFENTLTEG